MTDLGQLLEWLAAKRRHVLMTLEGLDDASARRVVVPSGWSPVHVVHHLALDVERYWFQHVLSGLDVDLPSAGAWVLPPPSRAAVVELYRAECARGDELLGSVSAGDLLIRGNEGPYSTAGEVILHVLVETTTHAGHLDVARELIDGRQKLVVDDGPL